MRTLRWMVGGAAAAVAVIVLGAIAVFIGGALFRFNSWLGLLVAVAVVGGLLGLLLLDATRDQEELDEMMFTRHDYPSDHGE